MSVEVFHDYVILDLTRAYAAPRISLTASAPLMYPIIISF